MLTNIPGCTDPAAVMNVVKTLYSHDPGKHTYHNVGEGIFMALSSGLAAINTGLFALYIPTLEKAKGNML